MHCSRTAIAEHPPVPRSIDPAMRGPNFTAVIDAAVLLEPVDVLRISMVQHA